MTTHRIAPTLWAALLAAVVSLIALMCTAVMTAVGLWTGFQALAVISITMSVLTMTLSICTIIENKRDGK